MRKIMIVCLALALGGSAWSRMSGPAEDADRFVDTFRWQAIAGYQEVELSRDGHATFRMMATDDDDNPVVEIADGGYRVVGDTAFIGLKDLRPDGSPEQQGEADADTMVMLLKGDNLIYLNAYLGNAPPFARK